MDPGPRIQLHPTLQVGRLPLGIVHTDATGCREHLDGIHFTALLPLQINLEGVTKSTVQPGDELGGLPVGHTGLHILQQTHPSFHSAAFFPWVGPVVFLPCASALSCLCSCIGGCSAPSVLCSPLLLVGLLACFVVFWCLYLGAFLSFAFF